MVVTVVSCCYALMRSYASPLWISSIKCVTLGSLAVGMPADTQQQATLYMFLGLCTSWSLWLLFSFLFLLVVVASLFLSIFYFLVL